ncbi:MAG: HAMP domain-containing sensor histidine kinase, partial [Rhodospirillales bacterium]|nr:HAMP domain-containing sensor histidine kinase [Rhodospirillales bacterium]
AQKNSEYAKDINKSALFLLDIVNDLLDMSRIEADALHPEDNRIDAVAVVVECLDMVRLMAQSKDIELVNNLPEKVPAVVGDHRMIKQVFLNILSNALKFTDRGGRVEVSVAVNSTGGMDFRFTDNGRGIAPGDIETIFQPFNRIVRPLVTREEGTGLGLPLAKALIDLHGGVFTIESELNESTTAVVALPAERILAEPSAA